MANPQPGHGQSPTDAPPGAGQRPPRIADLVLTILLLVVSVGSALIGAVLALTFFFIGDSCNIPGGTVCNSGALTAGILISAVGVWLPLVLAGTLAVVRMVRRRSSWWIALLGLLLAAGIWVGGAALALSSNPSFTV